MAFLHRHQLIDYSLLVGISFTDRDSRPIDPNASVGLASKALVAKPGVSETYYVELIDYLVKYGTKKKLESNLRGGIVQLKPENRSLEFSALSVTEPTEYADRLVAFIRDKTPQPRPRAS